MMICVPIVAKDTEQALAKVAKASAVADILEIRLDMMDAFDLREIIQAAFKPVLATYRSIPEGGRGSADHESQARYLLAALEQGADLVDVEWRLPERWRREILAACGGSGIVLSRHMPKGTPSREELEQILREMTETGAPVIKIVSRARTMGDNLRILDLIPRARDMGIEIIAFCMGPLGKMSRVFSSLIGGYLTFASLEAGEESAGGQIPAREMRRVLELLSP